MNNGPKDNFSTIRFYFAVNNKGKSYRKKFYSPVQKLMHESDSLNYCAIPVLNEFLNTENLYIADIASIIKNNYDSITVYGTIYS